MRYQKTIDGLVESGPYRHALFYHFPGGLRFELSEGGEPLQQVLVALQKATVICQDVFEGESQILVHLQKFVSASGFELRNVIRELKTAGVPVPKEREIWKTLPEENEDDCSPASGRWVNCAFEAPLSILQNLLWCALTSDFPSVRPNPNCCVYLVHANAQIVIHPYDDRGMDVICRTPIKLKTLYEKHHHWLLDFDKDAMAQTFKT
ncbi:DUF3885 domain-containing protein [Silvimonas amylolytica]|uniref:DUF3885 domain-containing protein n=1 Tax=Silvimonas amylolytica TaxID=449663 RepID=A0ABQ2PRD6_9NEIS|nr:DUF3885 domain-containing protein [Silvimonas amylolytica]GGP28198.1 hypothetical protein GCM10010971_40170 [Silvimonas amylolytica]